MSQVLDEWVLHSTVGGSTVRVAQYDKLPGSELAINCEIVVGNEPSATCCLKLKLDKGSLTITSARHKGYRFPISPEVVSALRQIYRRIYGITE